MRNKNLFLKINSITLGSVFVLILVGSIVRSLGAGMGCPDWPKCFGSYIPPTTASGLPANYLEIFRDQRLKKNERLANVMMSLGYDDLARKITNDPNVFVEHEFDVTKAWIEYINRLVGVLIGLLVFLNMVLSLSYWREQRIIPVMGVLIFLLTGFQGWIGSLVVSTNLLHGFITFHMVLALVIVALLIAMNFMAKDVDRVSDRSLFTLACGLLVLFIPQLLLGTEVRGVVDDLIASDTERNAWVFSIEVVSFFIHRSYSWLLLIGAIAFVYLVRKRSLKELFSVSKWLFGMILLAMLVGIGMVNFDFPFWLQPLHLILATGIFSLLFYLTLRLKIS